MKARNVNVRVLFAFAIMGASVSHASDIDFSRAGIQPLDKGSIRIRNVIVDGERYYGDFVWKGGGLKLVSYGKESIPLISITSKYYTLSQGAPANLNQGCMQEFGPSSRLADYRDLIGITSDNMSLETLVGMLDTGDNFFASYGLGLYNPYGDVYFLTTKDLGDEANLVTRLRGVIGVYSTDKPVDGRVICINRPVEDNPFLSTTPP